MQDYDYKQIAQVPITTYIPVTEFITGFLHAVDGGHSRIDFKDYPTLRYSGSLLRGDAFNTIISKLFENYSLGSLLTHENFLYLLHAYITYMEINCCFPSNHPYHQPLEEIIPLRVFNTSDLDVILETVYTNLKTGSLHWFILKALQKNLLNKKCSSKFCRSNRIVSKYTLIWESQGAKIIVSPKYTKDRTKALEKGHCLYFTGVDKVDWGDGSRVRSIRSNLQKEATVLIEQIFKLIERIPDPYTYRCVSSSSTLALKQLKSTQQYLKRYEKLIGMYCGRPNDDYVQFVAKLPPEALDSWVELCEARLREENELRRHIEELSRRLTAHNAQSIQVLQDFKNTMVKKLN